MTTTKQIATVFLTVIASYAVGFAFLNTLPTLIP